MTPLPGRGRAGGKVILLGEHAVVYGRPAVASGLALGLTVEARRGSGPGLAGGAADDPRGGELVAEAARALGLDPNEWTLAVESALPIGQGLGSSAALCIAALRALAAATARALAPADELALGRRLEGIFHGTPSGIDPAAAVLGTTFRFRRGEPPEVEPLAVGAPVPLVIGLGTAAHDTGAAVRGLRARWAAERARHEACFDAVAALVGDGVRALAGGDLAALGEIFDRNQAVLESLGVSSPEIAQRIAGARAAGALGAKLTGGGAGGAVIAIAPEGRVDAVAAALAAGGGRTLVVTIGAR